MTPNFSIADEAEGFLRRRAAEHVRPHDHECLCCYIARMVARFGCDGSHRHALHFRDVTAPRATALLDRLSRLGACCCDCELLLNGYLPRAALSAPRSAFDDEDEPDDDAELRFEDLPPCAGVRRGSIRACANWVRSYRR